MIQMPIEQQVEDAAAKAQGLLRSRYGLWALGVISFFESALPVPIITDPFLVAYILADKHKASVAVIVATLSSVLGGIFAYAVAFSFYEFIAAQYLNGSMGEQFYLFAEELKNGTFVLTILGAVTPVPYTVVAMAAGFVKGNVLVFFAASCVGRGFRYSVVGWLTHRFGQRALEIARRQLLLVTIICFVGAFLYFYIKH